MHQPAIYAYMDGEQHRRRRGQATMGRRAACSLYAHPSAGEQVTAYSPYALQWDCSCLGSKVSTIDITLYQSTGGTLHGWRNVPCAANTYTTTFVPTWWNSSTSANLYLQIQDSSQPAWATTSGTGPVFVASWNGTTPASATSNAHGANSTGLAIESVTDTSTASGVTGGKLAAAVAVPLLAGAIAVGIYILYSRRKGKTQRKRWSAYVDHRLSEASQMQWEHGGPPVAPGSRPMSTTHSRSMSMADQAHPASFTGSQSMHNLNRPGSVYSQNNFAGVGSTGAGRHAGHAYSKSVPSALARGANANQHRPTSSFYALDGHSVAETMSNANNGSISENFPDYSHPQAAVGKQIGHGATASRLSKISFADTSFGSAGSHGGHSRSATGVVDKRPTSSYYNNGNGSVSSPNHHRYRSSMASSVYLPAKVSPSLPSGGSLTNLAGVQQQQQLLHGEGVTVSSAVSPLSGRTQSYSALAEAAFPDGHVESPFVDAHAVSASSAESPLYQTAPGASLPQDASGKSRKANITVSTSMPFISQPAGRDSIMSPDELLQAYASAKSPTVTSRPQLPGGQTSYFGPLATQQQPQEELSEVSAPSSAAPAAAATRSVSGKKPKFSGTMGFAFHR